MRLDIQSKMRGDYLTKMLNIQAQMKHLRHRKDVSSKEKRRELFVELVRITKIRMGGQDDKVIEIIKILQDREREINAGIYSESTKG